MRWVPVVLLLGCALPPRSCQDPEDALDRLKAYSKFVEDLEAEAEVSRGAGWLRAHIWASRPGRIAVEISDPLRINVFHVFAVDGEVHINTGKGDLSTRLPLPVDLVALACGLPDVEGELVSSRKLGEGCEVTLEGDGVIRTLYIGRKGLIVREDYRTVDGRFLGRRRLEGYTKVGKVELPRRMTFSWRGHKVEVNFIWWKVNQGLSDDTFRESK